MFLDNDAKQNKKILLSFSFEKILLQKNLKIFFYVKSCMTKFHTKNCTFFLSNMWV